MHRITTAHTRSVSLPLFGALIVLAALAWVATGRLMAGMDAGPGTDPGSLGFFSGTWTVMMTAMMLPSLGPAAIAYTKLRSRQGSRNSSVVASALFVTGYLGLWAVAGLIGYAVLEVGRSLDGGPLAWDRAGRWTAAGALALAAVYELTPRKHACLARCRGGRGLPPALWRTGYTGALRMGIAHGGWCLSCCWALMAALFALGSMSLLWMVAIATAVALEKLTPWPRASTIAVASLLAALAIGIAASPPSVPGLTVPDGVNAMRAMHRMSAPASGPSGHGGSIAMPVRGR